MSIWHSESHLLTGAYAVDALEPAERDAFEHHLARCASCAAETRGLLETAARLAFGVALPPPPAMRKRVMEATYRTRQLPPVTTPLPAVRRSSLANQALASGRGDLVRRGAARRDITGGGSTRRALVRPGNTRRDITGGRSARPGLRLAGTVTVAAVSLAVVIVLGLAQVRASHQLDTARSVAAVLAAPDARTGSRPADGGTITVVISPTRREAVVTTAGLPPLPSGRVYQLWLLDSAGARSAGLLPAAQQGRTAPLLATDVQAQDQFGVTVEPAGGTTRPTTTPLVVIPLPA